MKTKKIILFVLLISFGLNSIAQVAINDDGSNPDVSAMLEVKSSDKGFLPPRMTTIQRDAISSPAEGLLIYNTTTQCYEGYNASWFMWVAFGCLDVSAFTVTNPITGEIWMDRNLGAKQVATSSTDVDSYGDYYQWGRGTDGHQIRISSTTETQSTGDVPGDSIFIIGHNDWRSTQNNNLWQGVNGINNPCPNGYRLPTKLEWEAEIATWDTQDPEGAFGSLLKLPHAGYRGHDGVFYGVGSTGSYWSSDVVEQYARQMYFYPGNAGVGSNCRADGKSVRCIKD